MPACALCQWDLAYEHHKDYTKVLEKYNEKVELLVNSLQLSADEKCHQSILLTVGCGARGPSFWAGIWAQKPVLKIRPREGGGASLLHGPCTEKGWRGHSSIDDMPLGLTTRCWPPTTLDNHDETFFVFGTPEHTPATVTAVIEFAKLKPAIKPPEPENAIRKRRHEKPRDNR